MDENPSIANLDVAQSLERTDAWTEWEPLFLIKMCQVHSHSHSTTKITGNVQMTFIEFVSLFLFIILRRIDNDALTAMLTANTAYLIEVILEYVFLIRLLHPYTVRGRFMQYGGMQDVSCHIYYMKKYSYGGGDVRSY